MNTPPYTCKPNKCISCDTIIHLPGESFEDKVRRGVYKEITFQLSDGSKMRVGFCKDCKNREEEIDKSEALRAIQEYWRNTIRSNRREIFEANGAKLEIVESGKGN